MTDDTNIGIGTEQRQEILEMLSNVVSDQHTLYIKVRNFHWNLRGPRFHTLHEFFEKLYTQLEAAIDDTAERIRMIGGVAPGSMQEYLERTSLKEVPGDLMHGDDCIRFLVQDNEACARLLRDSIPKCEEDKDIGTADFLTELLRTHEEAAWMLRSFLE